MKYDFKSKCFAACISGFFWGSFIGIVIGTAIKLS